MLMLEKEIGEAEKGWDFDYCLLMVRVQWGSLRLGIESSFRTISMLQTNIFNGTLKFEK